jgi:hypothetical protein
MFPKNLSNREEGNNNLNNHAINIPDLKARLIIGKFGSR